MGDRKEYFKKYVRKEENKEKNAARMRETYATEEGREYDREKSRYPRSRFTRGKRAAKRRKLAWTIEYDDYLTLVVQPCYHCNRSIADETGCGLDRIDNTLGYTLDNVKPCCKTCNRIRSRSMDAEEFKRQTKLNNRWNGSGE